MTLTAIRLQFQGGFAGKECELGTLPLPSLSLEQQSQTEVGISTTTSFKFSTEDDNSFQEFHLKEPMKGIRFFLNFANSTDFYGRIILYNLELHGES